MGGHRVVVCGETRRDELASISRENTDLHCLFVLADSKFIIDLPMYLLLKPDAVIRDALLLLHFHCDKARDAIQ